MKLLKALALIVVILAVPVALWVGIRAIPPGGLKALPTSSEFTALLIASVVLVVSVCGMILAILAIWNRGAAKRQMKLEMLRCSIHDGGSTP